MKATTASTAPNFARYQGVDLLLTWLLTFLVRKIFSRADRYTKVGRHVIPASRGIQLAGREKGSPCPYPGLLGEQDKQKI